MSDLTEQLKILFYIFIILILPMSITLGLISYDMKKKKEKKSQLNKNISPPCNLGLQSRQIAHDIFVSMITEDKRYFSSALKTFGFAFCTPIGSILFQLLLFRKSVFESYFIFTIVSALIGFLLLFFGYNIVKEKIIRE